MSRAFAILLLGAGCRQLLGIDGATASADGNIVDAPIDARGGSHDSGAPDATPCSARVTPPPAAHVHIANGNSNAGQGCVEANCHSAANLGTGAPAFQYAGTVMQLAVPGTGNAGATVTIETTAGMTVTATTDTDGNFYYPPPVDNSTGMLIPNPFPATTNVDVCPNASPSPMLETLVQGQGDCNAGGNCHGTGSTQGPIVL